MTLLDGSLWISFGARSGSQNKGPQNKPSDGGYPPYNIELLGGDETTPDVLRITLAVAGFALAELEVTVSDGLLLIRGERRDETPKDYLHRGIAARRFRRTFALVNGVEVRKAELHNGLLAIDLERPSRENVLKVGIKSAG